MLIEITNAVPIDVSDKGLKATADKKFYLSMDFQKIDNLRLNDPELYPLAAIDNKMHIYSPQINHISSRLPSSPLLSQYEDVAQVEITIIVFYKHMTHMYNLCKFTLSKQLLSLVLVEKLSFIYNMERIHNIYVIMLCYICFLVSFKNVYLYLLKL